MNKISHVLTANRLQKLSYPFFRISSTSFQEFKIIQFPGFSTFQSSGSQSSRSRHFTNWLLGGQQILVQWSQQSSSGSQQSRFQSFSDSQFRTPKTLLPGSQQFSLQDTNSPPSRIQLIISQDPNDSASRTSGIHSSRYKQFCFQESRTTTTQSSGPQQSHFQDPNKPLSRTSTIQS